MQAARNAGRAAPYRAVHWQNQHPETGAAFADFDQFLASLNQEKRKKIRQERKRVREAGSGFVCWRVRRSVRRIGNSSTPATSVPIWNTATRLSHARVFELMQRDMAANWVLFIAERDGHPIGSSLIALRPRDADRNLPAIAYGRYWGALERSIACISRPATTSPSSGASPMAWRGLKGCSG